MRILLTGASGYLGQKLVSYLLRKGYSLCLLARENSILNFLHIQKGKYEIVRYQNENDIGRAINEFFPDIILHTACCYGRSGETDLEVIDSNVRFGLVLIMHAIDLKKKLTFINIGTALDNSVSLYSKSKNDFAEWGKYYSQSSDSNIDFINVKLQQFYGEGDSAEKFPAQIFQAFFDNDDNVHLTDGYQLRDFIYIEDVLSGIYAILKRTRDLRGYIDIDLGTGVSVSIREFVEIVSSLVDGDTQACFGALKARPNEPLELKADIEILRSFGWAPSFDLASGSEAVIKALSERKEHL